MHVYIHSIHLRLSLYICIHTVYYTWIIWVLLYIYDVHIFMTILGYIIKVFSIISVFTIHTGLRNSYCTY